MFDSLDKFLLNAQIGVTRESYISMCEQLGDEVDPNKIPPRYSDFPTYVHQAYDIFNSMSDTYAPGMSPIYIGKDYSALPVFYDLFGVLKEYKMDVFEVIQYLDAKARQQAVSEAKRASKK